MRTSPVVLIIVNDDFYENKPEGYPLQGAKSGNERKRAKKPGEPKSEATHNHIPGNPFTDS